MLGKGLVMLNWIRAYFARGGFDSLSVDLFLERSLGDGILPLFDRVLFCCDWSVELRGPLVPPLALFMPACVTAI